MEFVRNARAASITSGAGVGGLTRTNGTFIVWMRKLKLLTNTKAFYWVENASSTVTDAAFQTKIPILPNWEPRFPDARSGWIATAKALNESRDNHRVTKSEAAT